MAKSKSGGSRAYIRGKLGADVYSIGKDGKGNKQQVVRSLAETVKNPQTINQMRGRMIMSTVMQAQSALAFIIDHSFDGVPAGQPSISEFIRRNYALIKADVAAHPSDGNKFGLSKYQQKGARPGNYVISSGNAQLPADVYYDDNDLQPVLTFAGLAQGFTAGDFRAALGLSVGDYFTIVMLVSANRAAKAVRLKITNDLDDATVITTSNASGLFHAELINFDASDSIAFTLGENGGSLVVTVYSTGNFTSGVIVSQQRSGAWVHNTCTLNSTASVYRYTEVQALPTYPVGSERFLNGGEL